MRLQITPRSVLCALVSSPESDGLVQPLIIRLRNPKGDVKFLV